MKKEAIDLIIEKNPKLAKSRAKLEAMTAGAFCLHRAWGFGKIREYDVASGKLIIDFDGDKTSHPMDPAFCVTTMEILPAKHLLVRDGKIRRDLLTFDSDKIRSAKAA